MIIYINNIDKNDILDNNKNNGNNPVCDNIIITPIMMIIIIIIIIIMTIQREKIPTWHCANNEEKQQNWAELIITGHRVLMSPRRQQSVLHKGK